MAPAPTKQLFQLRPKLRPLPEPYLTKFFSSSSSSSTSDTQDTTNTAPPPPSDSRHEPSPRPFSFSSISNSPNPPSGTADFSSDMRKRLAEFRRSTSSPAQSGADRSFNPPTNRPQHISFKDLYNRSVLSKGDNRNNEATQSRFSDMLKMRPSGSNVKDSPFVIGGSDHLPASIFAKEMKDKRGRNNSDRTKFMRTYGYKDLGEHLTKLRPEKRVEKNWFSLGELNDRLMKLRGMEKESPSMLGFVELRGALETLQMSNDENTKKTMIQRLDVLGQLGGTPTFMLHPPKEHLLEKYIHPDNLSSEEKMKLELQKVRDEFKMSESDCGSSRVQVAQLTTKIKYLSGVLHKKDKHSRKGLQAMVQKRKKLLKYLRRTDWDSYCLVLSKLGLRDNPDYKF